MAAMKLPFVRPHKPGYLILFMVPNYWGTGRTGEEAKANCQKTSGKRPTPVWLMYSVHPETCINGMGMMSYPKGEGPVLLCASEEV